MKRNFKMMASSIAILCAGIAVLFAKEPAPSRKPQEPIRPFPYEEREVSFQNQIDGMTLRGTLTLPQGKGPFPAAILVSGSGPQDRDEEILGHRPFLLISDYLTRRGFAVLRYDDRHFGMSSELGWRFTTADFALDARAALDFMLTQPEIDAAFVGIIGHSEGGVVAPIVAAEDKRVSFIVSLAGMGLSGYETGRKQWVAMANDARGALYATEAFDLIVREEDRATRERQLRELHARHYGFFDFGARTEFRQTLPLVASEWNRFMVAHDPANSWKRVQCPVLSLNGSHDIQVSPDENQDAIAKALAEAKNGDVTIVVVPGVNHLFQTVPDGNDKPYETLLREYAASEETIAPTVLETIIEWLNARRAYPRA